MENIKREIEVELEEEVEIEEEIEDDSEEENEKSENKEIEEEKEAQYEEAQKEETEENEPIISRNFIKENIPSTNITSGEGNYNNYDEINSYNINENKNNEREEFKIDLSNIDNNNDINSKEKVKNGEERHYTEGLLNIIKNEEVIDLLDEKKWENRKLGFIKLNEFICNNYINKKNFDIFFMYIYIKLNNFKETNFNIIKEGIQCLISLINKINNTQYENTYSKISDKKYIKILLNDLFEKIADNKIKDSYLNLLNVLNDNYSYKEILDNLFDKLKNTNKVNVLKEYALYIIDLIKENQILDNNNENNINIIDIIDFAIRLCNNSNPQIRKISISIFCVLYKYIGKDLKLFLKNIKNESTIKIIENEFSKIKIEEYKDKTININNNYDNKNNIQNEHIQKINIKRINISKEIPIQLLNDIDKGKWNEKKEGIDFLHKILDKSNNNISINGLDNLFLLIKNKLKDGNKNLVKIIIELLSHLIDALGPQIKKYSKTIILSLLSNLSEKTQQVREECIKCVQKWIEEQNFEIFCYHFPKLLLNDNYEMRVSILDLLLKNIDLITSQYNKTFLEEFIRSLLICLQDKASIIRNKTEEFMKKFKLFIREDYIKEAKEFKPVITEYLLNNINNIFGNITSFQSFKDDSKLIQNALNKNINTENKEKSHKHNYSIDIRTERKKKPFKINKNNRYDSCPNVFQELGHKTEEKNIIKTNRNNAKNNKKNIDINEDNNNKNTDICLKTKRIENLSLKTTNKLKKKEEIIYDKNNFKTLNNNETNKSFDNINKIRNKNKENNDLNNGLTSYKNKKSKNITKRENKNKNIIRLNFNTNFQVNYKNNNFINKSTILPNKSINSIKNKNKEIINNIFLPTYKNKDFDKQKRYEMDLKNNFLFEIQNFDYMKKLKDFTKKIFSKEFHKILFSSDIQDIILSINKLKSIFETKDNNDKLDNLINNIDIILKILGYTLSSNQSSSLIKSFFEFCELLINFNFEEKKEFNDIESNILLNIFCDKLLNNNEQLFNYSNSLIFKLNEIIGDNKIFMMLIHLIKYKIIKLRYLIIDIIIKIYSKSKIDNSTLSKALINIINLWFESDHNIQNKIKPMIEKIYNTLGKREFISLTQYLTDKQKDELFLKILEEDEDFFQENKTFEIEKKKSRIRSRSVCRRKSSNKMEKLNIIFNKKEGKSKILKNNNEIFDANKKNETNKISNNKKISHNESVNIKDNKINNRNLFLNDKSLSIMNNKKNSIKENKNEKNKNMKIQLMSNHNKNKSQLIEGNKILTKIISNQYTDSKKNISNKKINLKENKNSNELTSEKLNSLLLSIYESALKDNIKNKKLFINNAHEIIYHNFSKNKKIIIENSINIIATFINTTKKYFDIISKEIVQLKNLTNSFTLICGIKEILSNISQDVEKNLIELIFFVVLYKDLNIIGKNKEGMSILKNYSSIMLKVMDYCNPLNTIKILIEQIITNRISKPKLIEYYIKCLSIITHNIKDICDKINVAEVLFSINSFLVDYNKNQPKIQLQKIINNNLFITVKELVFEITEARKEKIIFDYNKYMKMKKNEDIIHDKNIKIWINEVIKTLDSDYLIK